MKKRLLSLLLALCTAVSLLSLPAAAAPTVQFKDIGDGNLAIQVEVLRLMGVMDGYGDGTFHPEKQLNRAQFCKMAVHATHQQDSLGLFRTVTIFQDVKPSYWAAPYINLAARGENQLSGGGGTEDGGKALASSRSFIAGYPDGKFHPERVVTMHQAVRMLLRILGYDDNQIGIWPESCMATGKAAGLLKGLQVVSATGGEELTRAQAAKLFVNLLTAKAAGTALYDTSKEATLVGVDGASGMIKVTEDKETPTQYPMANPVSETTLSGKGRLVMKDGVVLTFLPTFGEGTGSGAGSVIIAANGSEAGLSALAGNTHYQIYKNGTPATVGDLKKHDVATYYPDTNSIVVTDTRVTVFYEDAMPNPKTPTQIKALGTEFTVLPNAQASLSDFKPGEQMVLLLTADGSVAAAMSPDDIRGNAMGYVDKDGNIQLFCGSRVIDLKGKNKDEKYRNQVVRIYSGKKGEIGLSVASGGVRGDLNVLEKKLGSKSLASGLMLYSDGTQIGLSQLNRRVIPSGQITYARTNWAGEVDLIVMKQATDEIFGRAIVRENTNKDDGQIQSKYWVKVNYYDGGEKTTEEAATGHDLRTGDYVVVVIGDMEQHFKSLAKLASIKSVPYSAWTGKDLVQAAGHTYEVPTNVQCYNRTTGEWIDLDRAMAYADTADLYVKDGMVRIVEVR